jgi:hypothetical protein
VFPGELEGWRVRLRRRVYELNTYLLPSSTHSAFSQLLRAEGRGGSSMSQIKIPINPNPIFSKLLSAAVGISLNPSDIRHKQIRAD